MSRDTGKTLAIGAVVIIAVVLFLIFSGNDSNIEKNNGSSVDLGAGQSVTLEASADKSDYAADEAVNISLKLTNSGTTGTCLSELATGNIQFASITKDGVPVETRLTYSDFLISFSQILESRLVEVAPGESMSLKLSSLNDPGLGAMAFDTTIPDDTSGIATFYNVAEPGEYSIDIFYEYLGALPTDCAGIFEGSTDSVNVTFTVNE